MKGKEYNKLGDELYLAWKENPSKENLDAVILHGRPMCLYMFNKYKYAVKDFLTFEDFFSYFYMYMVKYDRLKKYDPERGSLKTFLFMQAKSSILNCIKKRNYKTQVVQNNSESFTTLEEYDDLDSWAVAKYHSDKQTLQKSELAKIALFNLAEELTAYELLCLYFHLKGQTCREVSESIDRVCQKDKYKILLYKKKNSPKSADNAITRVKQKGRLIEFEI